MRQLLHVTKALADPNRIRILCVLNAHGELCVCQLLELLGLAPSTTSKHLSLLATAGLIDSRKEGRWVHYRLSEEAREEELAALVGWLTTRAAGERAILEDERRMREILSYSPEELCQRQAQGLKCCSSAPATPAAAKWRKGGRVRSGAT